MLTVSRIIVCVVWVVVATAASAQIREDTTIVLPEAKVVAERNASATSVSTTRVTTIPVESSVLDRFRSLADILDASTGLYVRKYGPSGTATLAFRGTDPSQTEILLDGLRITDPQSGQVDLSLIPIVLLESVEILHGVAASSEASGGLGGTVRLRTIRLDEAGEIRIRGTSGAYGRRNLSGMFGAASGVVTGMLAVDHSVEDGGFSYVNDALTPPERTKREGADMSATSILAKTTVSGSKHRATLAGWLNMVERGLPGPGNAPPVSSRQEDDHNRAWLSTHHQFRGLTVGTDWALQTAKLRYRNETTATDDVTRTTSVEGRIKTSVPARDGVLIQSGLDWIRHHTGEINEHRVAVSTVVTGESDRVTIEASLRGESWFADSGTRRQLVPRAGLLITDVLHDGVGLKLSGGRSWTVPSLIDRFWVPGGNPELKPESGWSGELGVLFEESGLQIEATGFLTGLDDRIVWIPSLVGAGVQVWRPTNLGRVRSRGLEVSAKASAPVGNGRLSGSVSMGYTQAEDASDRNAASYGHQLKYVPRTVIAMTSSLEIGRFKADVAAQLVGRRYFTSDESASLPAYATLGGRASYRLSSGPVDFTFSVSAENLTNETYSTIRFYPMPPRHFGFGITFEWRNTT